MKRALAGAALDVACIGALIAVGVMAWPTGAMPGTPPTPEGTPAWATFHDLLLAGPDAGEWAVAALRLDEGRFEALDTHRMPTWTLLTAAMMRFQPDVVLAGHLVNHLLMLLLPVVLYGLARFSGGRGVGLTAGLWVAATPVLVESSRRYGVDPTVAFMIPMAMLAAAASARWWWLAPLGGAVAGLTMLSHYTTLAHAVPPLILVLLAGGRGWRRFAGTALFAAGTAALLWGVYQVYPELDPEGLARDVLEGIEKTEVEGGADRSAQVDDVKAKLSELGPGAAHDAIIRIWRAIRPSWMPWIACLVLPWLGALGLFLPTPGGSRRLWGALGAWPHGLALVLCLGPLPFLSAAGAEERYSHNLLPIVILLVARGAAVVPAALDAAVVRKLRWWPAGAIMLVIGGWWGKTAWDAAQWSLQPKPALVQDVEGWKVGRVLKRHFERGGHVASPYREATAMAGREYCPLTACPFGSTLGSFRECLAIMNEECDGEGGLAYVVLKKTEFDERSDARKAMDTWVAETWDPVGTVKGRTLAAQVFEIPRDELPARSPRMPPPTP